MTLETTADRSGLLSCSSTKNYLLKGSETWRNATWFSHNSRAHTGDTPKVPSSGEQGTLHHRRGHARTSPSQGRCFQDQTKWEDHIFPSSRWKIAGQRERHTQNQMKEPGQNHNKRAKWNGMRNSDKQKLMGVHDHSICPVRNAKGNPLGWNKKDSRLELKPIWRSEVLPYIWAFQKPRILEMI